MEDKRIGAREAGKGSQRGGEEGGERRRGDGVRQGGWRGGIEEEKRGGGLKVDGVQMRAVRRGAVEYKKW